MDKCTILLENSKSELLSTQIEHGLSLLIEVNNKKLLFDVGSSGIFYNNAKLMNIKLNDTKSIILSHSHYDHCSGLLSYLEKEKIENLYVGKNFFKPKYAINDSTITYLGCGFDKNYIESKNIQIFEINKLFEIEKSLYIVTNFKQHYEHEQIPQRFVHGDLSNLERDLFSDEVALIKKRKDGLTLIVGCAHRGILSIIKSINKLFDLKIDTVIGGVHLKDISNNNLEETNKELINLGIKRTYFCHCSGKNITEHLRLNSSIEANKVATGDIILL